MSALKDKAFSASPIQWLLTSDRGNLVMLLGFLVVIIIAPIAFFGSHQWWAQIFPPLFGVSAVMGVKYGSPMNWWVPYFGKTMFANMTKLADREHAGEDGAAIQREIEDWVKNCTKGRSWKVNSYAYRFLRKGDAAFFKLAWG